MNSSDIERLSFPNGASCLLLRPVQTTQVAPAFVVMMGAIAGVNDYLVTRARALCAKGYTVAVLDYFGREGVAPDISTPELIGVAVATLDDRRVLADLGEILEWARTQGFPLSKVGLFGFCIGGTYAALGSAQYAVGCAVDYYGQLNYASRTERKPMAPVDVAESLKAPLLCHYGDWDRLVSREEIDGFTGKLRTAQKPYELFIYNGAPHAFDEWFRPAIFRPAASSAAWERTLNFLNWHLRGDIGTH
ncbi:dienelactone hydrolase family protein [Dyella flava]|uniref:Dienelactone hydrolase family protein n=1 Tax=Dyella flava TaxID=1920170 RepID=A0ABS2K234_9GAMM|nr:dienelactone hydrolase family protein [Dyella flava]MBM7125279.1 dienelactone hydrolase family protein [Dyella flava]